MIDIKGICPLICEHRVYLENYAKPLWDVQRHLNPLIKDVVKKELIK
jgi:hypothetical protein